MEIKPEMISNIPIIKPIKQEYFSDNSVSLPGILGQSGPVGFEPGMFNKHKDGEMKQKLDPSKVSYLIKTIHIFHLIINCFPCCVNVDFVTINKKIFVSSFIT